MGAPGDPWAISPRYATPTPGRLLVGPGQHPPLIKHQIYTKNMQKTPFLSLRAKKRGHPGETTGTPWGPGPHVSQGRCHPWARAGQRRRPEKKVPRVTSPSISRAQRGGSGQFLDIPERFGHNTGIQGSRPCAP